MTLPRRIDIFIPRFTRFCLITSLINSFSNNAPIGYTLRQHRINHRNNSRLIIGIRWDICFYQQLKDATDDSRRSTSDSMRASGLLSGRFNFSLIAETIHAVLSLPEFDTASLNRVCSSAGETKGNKIRFTHDNSPLLTQ